MPTWHQITFQTGCHGEQGERPHLSRASGHKRWLMLCAITIAAALGRFAHRTNFRGGLMQVLFVAALWGNMGERKPPCQSSHEQQDKNACHNLKDGSKAPGRTGGPCTSST